MLTRRLYFHQAKALNLHIRHVQRYHSSGFFSELKLHSWAASSLRISAGVILVSGLTIFGLYRGTAIVHSDSNRFPLNNDTYTEKISKPLARAKPIESFTLHSVDVEHSLHEHEESHQVDATSGIRRYDTSQLATNHPTEDDHSEAIIPVPFGTWSLFAVFDGHSGWETSAWLRENMLLAVLGSFCDLFGHYGPKARPSATEIDDDLKDTFKALDNNIVHESIEQVFKTKTREAGINLLAPAYAGSCAILAFHDSESKLLRVALTGDSRAVLGRKSADGTTYEVKVLSVDQNGDNPLEKARMEAEHPGEEVVRGSRCMGYGMARAFGDSRMKWSREVQDKLKSDYLGRTPPSSLLTPPYFTAEPVITTTEIQPGDFLIMATDGLWECLTNEDAVGLVGMWLDKKGSGKAGCKPADLPVKVDSEEYTGTNRYRDQWNAEKRFVNADRNAATHLIRNALGGADEDLAAALFSMRSPRRRTYMDDITATVVFFADEQPSRLV